MKKIVLLICLLLVVSVIPTALAAKEENKTGGDNVGVPFQHLQTQVDSFFDVFTEVSKLFGVDSFFDVFTELKAKDEHIETEIVSMQLKSDGLQTQVDSFFDVFTELNARDEQIETEIVSMQLQSDDLQGQIDSFFDVFTELSVEVEGNTKQVAANKYEIDSFFDIIYEINSKIDSFFDVFTELKAKDEHIETEIVSMQLQSKKLHKQVDTNTGDIGLLKKEVEDVVQSAEKINEAVQTLDDKVKGIGDSLQRQIDAEEAGRIATDINLQNQIDTIELTPGPQGDQGIQGIQGPAGGDGADGAPGADGVCECDDLRAYVEALMQHLCTGSGSDPICDDHDGDGDYYTENQGDCDDTDPSVNPGESEIIVNGKDDDCDPTTPDNPLSVDNDGDGFTENEGDCDDSDDTIYPTATETECDLIDQDCDGSDLCAGQTVLVDGLYWKKCSQGQNEDQTCSGTALKYQYCYAKDNSCDDGTILDGSWDGGAWKTCNDLNVGDGYGGRTNWRVPTIEEFRDFYDFYSGNTDLFPNPSWRMYWSSTNYLQTTTNAHAIRHSDGWEQNVVKDAEYPIRCVSD